MVRNRTTVGTGCRGCENARFHASWTFMDHHACRTESTTTYIHVLIAPIRRGISRELTFITLWIQSSADNPQKRRISRRRCSRSDVATELPDDHAPFAVARARPLDERRATL
eukprot:3946761-Prymnesium_polylepis.1